MLLNPGQPDPPVPDSVRVERERCMEQVQFVTWITALPRPGEEIDAGPTWIVRLVECTDYRHAVFDVSAMRTENGSGWQVLEVDELYRVYSSRPPRAVPFASSQHSEQTPSRCRLSDAPFTRA
jgi:hypothetical protein